MSAAGFIRLCVCLAVLPKITLSLTLLGIALGYIIGSQCKGFLLVAKDTGQPCVWACIFALAGIAISTLTLHSAPKLRPRYHAALPILLYLDTACVVVAFVSFCALQQPHSAVITGVSALVLLLICASVFHSKHGEVPRPLSWGSPKVAGVEQSNDTRVSLPSASATHIPTNNTDATSNSTHAASRAKRCGAACATCCLWTLAALLVMCVVSFAVGNACTASEAFKYRPPGVIYRIPVEPGSSRAIELHMYCTGVRASSARPLLLFEAGGGGSGFDFYGTQQRLASSGIRSCAYDRPGFGWSEPLPVGWASVGSYQRVVSSLLNASGEQPPYIMVGHSAGVELVQIFTHFNPTHVVGMSLLDGYPDYLRLLGYTKAQRKAELQRVCSILQVARSFEAVGLVRPVYLKKADFDPSSKAAMYSSAYTNGHNFDSQWREYCRHQEPDNTDFLASVAGSSGGANPHHPDIRWPQVGAAVWVQVISASATVNNRMAGHEHNVYYTQAKAYNATLSPTHRSEWLICEGCTHGFPWMKTSYLTAALTSLYQRV